MINDKVISNVFFEQMNFTKYLENRIKKLSAIDSRLKSIDTCKIISYFILNEIDFNLFILEYEKINDFEFIDNMLEIDKHIKIKIQEEDLKTNKSITDFIEYLDSKYNGCIEISKYDEIIKLIENLSLKSRYYLWNMCISDSVKYSIQISKIFDMIMLKKCEQLKNADFKSTSYLDYCDTFFQKWLIYAKNNLYEYADTVIDVYNMVFHGVFKTEDVSNDKCLIKLFNFKKIEEI